jgi:hypothetical protein
MRPNPSDPERTLNVAIVATRLRSKCLGELRPEPAPREVAAEVAAGASPKLGLIEPLPTCCASPLAQRAQTASIELVVAVVDEDRDAHAGPRSTEDRLLVGAQQHGVVDAAVVMELEPA